MSLEKVLELGKNLLAGKTEEKREAESKAVAEAEAIAKEKASQEPQKTAEEIAAAEAEAKKLEADALAAEADEESLLDKEEAELSDDEKAKRKEVEAKRDEEPIDKKLLRAQRKFEKRIGKVTGQRKDLERQLESERKEHDAKMVKMEDRLNALETPKVEDDNAKAEQERIDKYLSDDKDLPVSERREMSKEDWETWNDEDPLAAQRWVQRNETRRKDERDDVTTKAKIKVEAEAFMSDQDKSVQDMMDRFPDVRPTERALELKAEGMAPEKIHQTLMEEIPEYRITTEINKEHPEWSDERDFGKLVGDELVKRMDVLKNQEPAKEPKEEPKTYTEEELQAKIKESQTVEADRRDRIDNSNSSTTGRVTPTVNPKNADEKQSALEKIFEKAGLDPAKAKERLKIRANQGHNIYDPTAKED